MTDVHLARPDLAPAKTPRLRRLPATRVCVCSRRWRRAGLCRQIALRFSQRRPARAFRCALCSRRANSPRTISPTKSRSACELAARLARRSDVGRAADGRVQRTLSARSLRLSLRRRRRPGSRGDGRPRRRRGAARAGDRARTSRWTSSSPRSRTSPARWTPTASRPSPARRRARRGGRGQPRQPARSRQRRAGGARFRRYRREGGRPARERHPYRADPRRPDRSACASTACCAPSPTPAGAPAQALISRLKILAGLNIAERRLPQDGGARLKVGRGEIDVRVATLPTQHGESAVIRLLPRDRGLLDIDKLGLQPARTSRACAGRSIFPMA